MNNLRNEIVYICHILANEYKNCEKYLFYGSNYILIMHTHNSIESKFNVLIIEYIVAIHFSSIHNTYVGIIVLENEAYLIKYDMIVLKRLCS